MNYKKKNFDSLMFNMQKNLPRELDKSEELLSDSNFVEIFNHSEYYLEDVSKFLMTKSFNNQQAGICIYSMQNLSASSYANLITVFYNLFNKHLVTSRMLETAILPNFLNRRIVLDNHQNEKIKKILNDIRSNKMTPPDLKNLISGILDGKY